LLDEQRRYYAARAPEYDDWWFRRGRYALAPEDEARWLADVAEVEDALRRFEPRGDVLELAAGTGLWTRHLVGSATRVVAVDANPETLALNRARCARTNVDYVVADVFGWQPEERFDVCFFGFWLSHVPAERFDDFWRRVRAALEPDGRVFLVDSGAGDPAHARRVDGETERRSVSDGREFRIVKRYWSPEALARAVAGLGFALDVRRTANGLFLYGGGS
jgi:demethylmenaquinone methyltransferase/2-methoxy-6-polyprenyl-1,4-benzoquinol methylase